MSCTGGRRRRAEGLNGFVLMCLWSNPFISAVGCTASMAESIAKYTGMPMSAVRSSIATLDQAGQIMVDQDTSEALVPGWLDPVFKLK